MAKNTRRFSCDPESVFAVLADGWLYPVWVVGASRMRDVSADWPEVGAHIRHSIGVWPLLLNDRTTSVVWDPPHRIALTARGWPIGEARVVIDVEADGDGCVVRMREYPLRGPGRFVPRTIRNWMLGHRNRETLRRLAYLAEGRHRPGSAPAGNDDAVES